MAETDYSKLIDEETWAFIRETESWYPPDAVTMTIQEQRDVYDQMCRAFFNGYPEGVSAQDKSADGVPVRCYAKAGTEPSVVILYFHGGGFVVGGLESHDDVCAEICDRTGQFVVSVDYRLVPEHVHPAAFDDCITSFKWVQKEYDLPVILVGDSAGGNLAAAVSHETRNYPNAPVGKVLIYPGLGGEMDKGSYVTHANSPLLTITDINFYAGIRSGGADVTGDTSYAPLWDTNFANLPPTVIIAAECDPLSDDGEKYCAELQKAGVSAVCEVEKGLVHGYLRARHKVKRAQDSFTRIIDFINELIEETSSKARK